MLYSFVKLKDGRRTLILDKQVNMKTGNSDYVGILKDKSVITFMATDINDILNLAVPREILSHVNSNLDLLDESKDEIKSEETKSSSKES